MFYFFVSFPIITVQPAIYNSYFRKICHGLRSFPKKNPAKQDSPPAAGRVSDILPFRRSAIRAERFLSYRNEVSYTIKRMCLGTFSRRGAVALATIYPCAECASSRSIFIVWKRSFLYDKKALCRECSQSTGPRIPILLASLTAAPARTYCRSLEWRFRNPRRSRR